VYFLLEKYPDVGIAANAIPLGDLMRVLSMMDGDTDRTADHFRTSRRALKIRLASEGIIETTPDALRGSDPEDDDRPTDA
jgi:hypothetical protein